MGNIAPQHSASGKSQSEPLTPVRMAGIKSGNDRCRRGCGKTDREAHRGDTGHDHPAPSEVTTHCSEELNGPSGVSAPEKKACAETKVWLGEFTVLSPSPPPGEMAQASVSRWEGRAVACRHTLGPWDPGRHPRSVAGRSAELASQRANVSATARGLCRSVPGVFQESAQECVPSPPEFCVRCRSNLPTCGSFAVRVLSVHPALGSWACLPLPS